MLKGKGPIFSMNLVSKSGLNILIYGLLFFLVVGCAVNPATKRREFMTVSEEQEFRIGQQLDDQIHEEMGIYLELPQLRAKLKQLGENIGKQSEFWVLFCVNDQRLDVLRFGTTFFASYPFFVVHELQEGVFAFFNCIKESFFELRFIDFALI